MSGLLSCFKEINAKSSDPIFGTLGINWLKLVNYKNADQRQNPHLIFEDRASGTGKTSTWTVVVTEISLAAFSSGYC